LGQLAGRFGAILLTFLAGQNCGELDREVGPVSSEEPLVIEGHAFTTGAVPRASIEHVLPSAWVEIGIQDCLGCDANACMNHHSTAEELAGKPLPDHHHWHEHATRFW
jgi:7,8-dihydropterin-6-yl-methyl-4-(beta-D-ribofuranosyl)aminobenzene 5'-phosphate synthase